MHRFKHTNLEPCTINSKINGTTTTKGVYLPISKLHPILAVANLLAHNNLWYLFGSNIYFAVDGTSYILACMRAKISIINIL